MNGPDRFEDQLREALRRVEPPGGLEQRILARLQTKRRRRLQRWLAIAASVFFVAGGSFGLHQHRRHQAEQQRLEIVRQQFTLALQITSRRLANTDMQLRNIGVKQIQIKEVEQ